VSPPEDVTALTEDATELGLPTTGQTPVVVAASRRRRRWPWVLLAVAVVLGLAGTAYAVTRSHAVPTHRMPALQTRTEADAIAALKPLKVNTRITRTNVDGVNAGLVIDTKPAQGASVKEHSTVLLNVSAGPPPVPVPDLTNITKAQAIDKLTASGLAVGAIDSTYSENVAAGTVLDWNPKGQQPRHTPIALAVSAGPRPRTVPSVAGKTFDQAAAALQQIGLTAVRADVFSDTVQKDQVIGTSPAAGASVDRGGKVTVNVSKGPDLVAVPDVSGKSVQDATTTMQQAGIQVGNVFGPPTKKVFVTDPPAGTQVHRNSSVNLYTK
jgi:serine/threonine-protein kinase